MRIYVTESEHLNKLFVDFSCWLKNHPVLASVIILSCALSLRMIFVYRAAPSQLLFPDSGTYLDPALSLRESGSFLNKYQTPEVTRTPGYPLFLAALMTWFGTELRTVLFVQAVIVSASVVVIYCLARHVLPPMMAFTGGLLAGLSPWASARAGFLLSDGVFLLVLSVLFLAMYFVIRYLRSVGLLLAGGVVLGLLTAGVIFVRPVFPLIVMVAGVMFLLHPGKKWHVWLLVASMLVSALVPMHLWKMRNFHEAQFNGFSDVSGKAAWQWLASSVKGQVAGPGGDRWMMLKAAELDETRWKLSLEQADAERWRRATEVFRAHPFVTLYVFICNAGEALIHPQPSILTPAGLNFQGDVIVLGSLWCLLIVSAAIGLRHVWGSRVDHEAIDRSWVLAMLVMCCVLTLTAGVSFGAGARYRMPLELIVPLLAGVGIVRIVPALVTRNS